MSFLWSWAPDFFDERFAGGLRGWQWMGLLGLLTVGSLVAFVVGRLAVIVGLRMTRFTKFRWDDILVEAGRGPLALVLWASIVHNGFSALRLPSSTLTISSFATRSLLVLGFSWYLLRVLQQGTESVRTSLIERQDPGRTNRFLTQLTVLRRVAEVGVYVVSAAILLMQFDVVRSVGVSLLASAGIAGLVVGLAAQKSISTLLAGIQLTLTQPVGIGDTVVVEGENGTVEEITLSYVQVRVWDNRRLIVPILQFLEKPFQNWSKGTPELLGPVMVEVDFSADVVALREEVKRLLAGPGADLWDGKTAVVQVVELGSSTMTLRILLSAPASKLWDLRCLVREGVLDFLKARPGWLPRTRQEVVTRAAGEEA